ncbi:hypothetical protein BARRETLEMON_54 [Arthrobacter phage BarretLemon]|uniref:Uncharacterized protein n=1 Tax=Arthrobacter phage BarretLemon TaxID=1796994 RepID=A0A140G781_9CAUD|nr:hypothetical protein BJD79_gp54 [Arthrobacter phage BarretLemon]AMM44516.1 hypothetical protein BARRETLEMON_54 [Arthrobacter phage BarretLemon]
MTAIYEALKAEQTAKTDAAERWESRQERLIEFLAVADKFTDICKLLTTGEPLLLAAHELSLNNDDEPEIAALFTDATGEQYATRGVFKGEGVPPFPAVLLAAHSSVLQAAEQAGIDALTERLTL